MKQPEEALEDAMSYIEQYPDEHDQGVWRCETGMCLAGHLAALAEGVEWVAEAGDNWKNWVLVDGEPHDKPVEMWASRYLNLRDAYPLFRSSATIPELRRTVDAYRRAVKDGHDLTDAIHEEFRQILMGN